MKAFLLAVFFVTFTFSAFAQINKIAVSQNSVKLSDYKQKTIFQNPYTRTTGIVTLNDLGNHNIRIAEDNPGSALNDSGIIKETPRLRKDLSQNKFRFIPLPLARSGDYKFEPIPIIPPKVEVIEVTAK
ncbi:MAG: hypothetical protein ACM34K_15555 [Bacillota bacterium]